MQGNTVPPGGIPQDAGLVLASPVGWRPTRRAKPRDDAWRLWGVELRREVHGRAKPEQLLQDALVVMPRMIARAGFLRDLGLIPGPHPSGLGEHIPAERTGRTAVAGVWAAGNVTDLGAQVGGAAAAGAMAAAEINADLAAEDTRVAVAFYSRDRGQ
jgi:thioredoxin reductase